jgi:hypothetical protein
MTESLVGGASAAPLSMRATAVVASAVVRAARQLFTDLERGRRIDATALRNAMEAAFGASDASGAWNWKTAYDACEAAIVLFLRRYGAAMRAKATSPTAMLLMLARITNLLPTSRRWAACRHHRRKLSPRQPSVDRVLRAAAGTGPGRILGGDRWRCLCQARNQYRHPTDRYR